MAITRRMQHLFITNFMDESYKVADKVELIHASTVFIQCWLLRQRRGIEKMLNDDAFQSLVL